MADIFETKPNNFGTPKSITKYLDHAGLISFWGRVKDYVDNQDLSLFNLIKDQNGEIADLKERMDEYDAIGGGMAASDFVLKAGDTMVGNLTMQQNVGGLILDQANGNGKASIYMKPNGSTASSIVKMQDASTLRLGSSSFNTLITGTKTTIDNPTSISNTLAVTGDVTAPKFIGNLQGKADSATKSGESSIYMYPQYGNEINFGGTDTKTELYFGYRGVDSKPAPTTYIFGKLDSLATIKAKFVGNLTGTADNTTKFGGKSINAFMTYEDSTNYVNANFNDTTLDAKAASTYIEYWSSNGGWYNSKWGTVTAQNGFVGNIQGTLYNDTAYHTDPIILKNIKFDNPGGYERSIVGSKVNNNRDFNLGIYGNYTSESTKSTYAWMGYNAYNGVNLRIYSDGKLQWGDYPIIHSNNIGSYKAGSTVGTLTIAQPSGSTTFNGSTDTTININRTTLGLDKVMDYIGKTSTPLSDGSTTNPITIDSKSITAVSGNVVIDKDGGREYIWNGSAWELFGADDVASSYKPKQSVVNDPTASGTSTTFIDTISQDENGKITVTKKNIPNIPTIPSSLPANGGNADTVDNKHASDFVLKAGDTMTGSLTTNNFLKITAPASDGTPTRNAAIIRTEVASSDANKALVHIGSNYGYISVNENNTTKPSAHVDAIGIYRGVIGVGGTFTYDTLKSNQSNNISLEAVGKVKALSFIENGQPLSGKYLPLSGGTISGGITINDSHGTSSFSRNVYGFQNTAGFARDVVNIKVDDVNKFGIGAYGVYKPGATDNDLTYAYIGCNGYDGLNLRIDKSSIKWGTNDIIHSGNIGSQSVNYATSAGSAGTASKCLGTYTNNGGEQYPSYVTGGTTRWNMMRNSTTYYDKQLYEGYCDWMLMDNYTGFDVPYVTGIGVLKSDATRAFIMSGAKGTNNKWKIKELATKDDITNYYHTRSYSSGLQISTGTGVSNMYVPYATDSQAGVVSTGSQTFSGNKTFKGSIKIGNTATLDIDGSALRIDKELKLTAGGTADICSGIACALKADRLQVKNLISENIILGSSNTGTQSNMSFNIQKYGSISNTAPASLTTLLTVNTTGNVGIGTTSPTEKLDVAGNVKANSFIKSGSSDSYVLLGGGGHKAISDFSKASWKTFTPAETALTNDDVLSTTGEFSLAKGSWYYAGNGYLPAGEFGNIDLAGCSVLTFGGNSGGVYTQLFITSPAPMGTNAVKANEILFYNNHGESYSPGWTRVLTNRNYTEYIPTSLPWSSITSKPTFATVATSGSYNDLTNKPTIPTSLPWSSITSKPTFATVATSGSYNDLTNKPTIPTIPSSLPSNGIINAYTTNGITSPAISVSGAIRFDTMVCTQYLGNNLGNTNKFTGCNNAILSISRFENNQYTTQLGFSGNGIYARIFNGKTPDTLTLWKTMIMDDGAGNVTANAFYINSDERLKTFGDDIKVDFDELAKLRKSHFVFNNNPTKQEIGVSAQEVQKIYPEIVNETEEGTLSVDYSKLAVVALAAIDKLNQRVQELENKLAKYE